MATKINPRNILKFKKVLTTENVRDLIGKEIYWTYDHDCNQAYVYKTKIGSVVREIDYYETQPCEGWKSRADYWRAKFPAEKLERHNRLMIVDENDNLTFMYALPDDGIFYCSDDGRAVYFVEVKEYNQSKDILKRGHITHALTNGDSEIYGLNQTMIINDWSNKRPLYWSEVYCEPGYMATIIRKGVPLIDETDEVLSELLEKSKWNLSE